MANFAHNLPRVLRDLSALFRYPVWLANSKPTPDNHVYKVRRIIALARKYQCLTLIETGTFYGQTVAAARKHFQRVLSVELHAPLFEFNQRQFRNSRNVKMYFGSSEEMLASMISEAEGTILFWLDGHFSGDGTALGDKVSPIIKELEIIRKAGRSQDVILIDDVRLFDGKDYPTLETANAQLRDINPAYNVTIDGDCLIATP